MKKSRAFFKTTTRQLTPEEYGFFVSPYECQKRVLDLLDGWERTATMTVDSSANEAEISEAKDVLAGIKEVRKAALIKDNIFLVIEQAIHLGSVAAQAHTLPFEAIYKTGHEFKEGQRKKATKPRSVLTDAINEFAFRKDGLGDYLSPKDLWNQLIGWLDQHGHDPRESLDLKKDGDPVVEYADQAGRDRTIKFTSFEQTVSRVRKRKLI